MSAGVGGDMLAALLWEKFGVDRGPDQDGQHLMLSGFVADWSLWWEVEREGACYWCQASGPGLVLTDAAGAGELSCVWVCAGHRPQRWSRDEWEELGGSFEAGTLTLKGPGHQSARLN